MEKYINNIPHGETLRLAEQVECLPGQIVSKTLAQDRHRSLTLFAFSAGEEISSHESDGDAMVTVLESSKNEPCCKITIDEKSYFLNEGETIVMPSKTPHAVYAEGDFKMLLTVIFP